MKCPYCGNKYFQFFVHIGNCYTKEQVYSQLKKAAKKFKKGEEILRCLQCDQDFCNNDLITNAQRAEVQSPYEYKPTRSSK